MIDEEDERDKTENPFDNPRHSRTAPAYPLVPRLGMGIFSIVTFPITFSLSVISSVFQFVFRVLRIPIPRVWLGSTSTGGVRRPLLLQDPASAADRFVRELEEETGATCASRAAATSHPIEKATDHPAANLLPDFWIGSYEDALKAAQDELKILCVVLLSEEHDDNMEFRRLVWLLRQHVSCFTDFAFTELCSLTRISSRCSLKMG